MGMKNRLRKIERANKKYNLQGTKEAFLQLCAQYEAMGKMYAAMAGDIRRHSEPGIINPLASSMRERLQVILDQYREIGEQLKETGLGLDSLGGDPVLKPREEPHSPGDNGESDK
jgi:hypothetical protein